MNEAGTAAGGEDEAAQRETVAQIVLEKFFAALTKSEGFADIGPALRKVVLKDGVFAEPAIRAALFPETP